MPAARRVSPANSHKVITNLLDAVCEAGEDAATPIAVCREPEG